MSKQDLVGIAKVFGMSVGVNVAFLAMLWVLCGVLTIPPWVIGLSWVGFVVWWSTSKCRLGGGTK
jgi:hypothetical protein